MKFSIVTATLNSATSIGDAMRCLQGQTYENFEHIVQDGASTDDTLVTVSGLADERVKLESAKDSGIYDALNRGIRRSSGDVIGILHSDDVFASTEILERVAKVFEQEDVDGVYGDLDYISQADPTKVVRHWCAGFYHPGKLRWGWMPPHPTLFLRRDVFERIGTYDTSFEIAADYDLILRLLSTTPAQLGYVPGVLVKMRMGGESTRSVERLWRKSREDLTVVRRNEIGGLMTVVMKNVTKLGQLWYRS